MSTRYPAPGPRPSRARIHPADLVPWLIALLALALLLPAPARAHLSLIQQGGACAGALEAGDRLGEALAVGDFNGDGYDDVAMGSPGEDVSALSNAGAVIVNFGTYFGVTQAGSFVVTATSVGQASLAGARFGHALASADFNLDGYDDLVIGAPFENVGGAAAAGRVYIVYGNSGGLNSTSIALDETDAGGGLENNDRFGFSFAVGNFNGDGPGYPDLAIGAPGEDGFAGAVAVNLFGGPLGLTHGLATFIKQSNLGSSNEANDEFGRALAAGNVAGTAHDDLLIGSPFEAMTLDEQGVVWLLRGSDNGITTASFALYSAGSKDFVQSFGHFGYALTVGHFFSGSYQSVAIGEPGRHLGSSLNAGRVVVARGGAGGLDFAGTNGRILTEDSGGLNAVETNDRFGMALASGEFGVSDGYDDVAIGAPLDGFGVSSLLGNFIVFPGGSGGPTGNGWSGFNQGTCNEPAEPNDEFASAIAFGRFDATNKGGFVVGAPGERYEDIHCAADQFLDDAGMVHVIAPWRQAYGLSYKSSASMDCEGNLVFTQKPFERVKIASTTKALTVLMACEAIQGGVSPNLVYQVPAWVNDQIGGSQVPLQTGEFMTLLNLMYTGMLISGNDAMHAIADILGSGATSTARVVDFVNDMNARAAAIGMGSSHFHNPAGLDGNPIGGALGDHYSTAFDMALLSRACMQNTLFRQIVGTKSWTITRVVPGPDFQQTFNNFINNVLNNVQYSTGIKGGGTPCAATTGIYSAKPPLSGGQAVATWFGSPQNSWSETGALLGLGMAQCNVFIPQFAYVPKLDYKFANVWALWDSSASSVVDLDVPSDARDRDALVEVLHQDGSGPGRADLRIWRMAEVLVGPGITRRFGIAPFSSHDSLTIMNLGAEIARLQIVLSNDGTSTDVTLAPGEQVVLPPADNATGAGSFAMDVHNLATGGEPAHLSVEQIYDFMVLVPQDGSAPFSARLMRDGEEVNDQVQFLVRGRDTEGDRRLFLAIHDPESTVDVGPSPGPPSAGPALRLLSVAPNPFVQRTRLSFELRVAGRVSASIHDLQGRLVKRFPETPIEAGRWQLDWDGTTEAGSGAKAGIYFYRLRLDGREAATGRVVLQR